MTARTPVTWTSPHLLRNRVGRLLGMYGERGPRDQKFGDCVFCGVLGSEHDSDCVYRELWEAMDNVTHS